MAPGTVKRTIDGGYKLSELLFGRGGSADAIVMKEVRIFCPLWLLATIPVFSRLSLV